jgi:galactose oxidase
MGDTVESKAGKWEPLFDISNVAAHASLLPDGKRILYWGRRANPKETTKESMSENETKAFILNIATGESVRSLGKGVLSANNLFCSGHCWLPDGKLAVFGGHIRDGFGSKQACIFDPDGDDKQNKQWTALNQMTRGRWYPSVICLGDGSVLVASGSEKGFDDREKDYGPVPVSVLFKDGGYKPVVDYVGLVLYPDFQLDAKGRIFMAGPQFESKFLDLSPNKAASLGTWVSDPPNLIRRAGFRDYAACVMYEPG